MSHKSLNVWRVYMDLLSNFMGLVLLGGIGLMVLIGGAIVHASMGAMVPAGCNVTELQRFQGLLNRGGGSEAQFDKCAIKLSDKSLRFQVTQTSLDPRNKEVQAGIERLCRKMIDVVTTKPMETEVRPLIEVVGHASNEYTNTGACGTKAGQTLADFRSSLTRYQKELYARISTDAVTDEAPSVKLDPLAFDKLLCNGQIAGGRALEIVRQCVDYAQLRKYHYAEFNAKAWSSMAVISEPQNTLTEKGDVCASTHAADVEQCQRTVTLRVHFLPQSPGKAKSAAGNLAKPAG